MHGLSSVKTRKKKDVTMYTPRWAILKSHVSCFDIPLFEEENNGREYPDINRTSLVVLMMCCFPDEVH